jgi:hypothetical protein
MGWVPRLGGDQLVSLRTRWISDARGNVTTLRREDFAVTPGRLWRRDATCAYPVEWGVTIKGLRLHVRPAWTGPPPAEAGWTSATPAGCRRTDPGRSRATPARGRLLSRASHDRFAAVRCCSGLSSQPSGIAEFECSCGGQGALLGRVLLCAASERVRSRARDLRVGRRASVGGQGCGRLLAPGRSGSAGRSRSRRVSRSPALADIIGARRVRTAAMISSGSIPCR